MDQIEQFIDQAEAWFAKTNIAAELPEDTINTIAARVVEDYKVDEDSRDEWLRSNREIIDLAKLAIKKKTYAGEPVANVKYPLITNAIIQFAARAYPEIIKGSDVVKAKIIGKDPDGIKTARGKRVSDHMSWQILNDMPDWEDGVDQLLFTLPAVGCAFKKTYRCGTNNRNVSEMVFPEDLVVHYKAASLEKAARATHIVELTRNEIVERIRSGVYLDFDVEELGTATSEETDQVDQDTPHRFLEQHRWYDLDKDGYQEPYIITVHLDSQKLVRISARYELSGIKRNDKNKIMRIEPVHYFTRYLFMPAVDGSFYGMGFGSLLQSINVSANTIINQLIDSGTANNRQSGFIGRGIQLGRGQSLKVKAGEWKFVQATGEDLRKNMVPLITKEPSHVLFQLLGMLIEAGKELAGITDVLSGQSPGQNASPTTTLALIEQGLQVYTAIHKRIHRSLYQEFQKIRRLNILYTTNEEYLNVIDDPAGDKDADYKSKDHDIIPVSDPNATTNMQRIMKAKSLLELQGKGLDDNEITRRYLEALQIDDMESLFPKEQAPNPAMEMELRKFEAEINNLVAEQNKRAAETELVTEKINTERVVQEVKMQGTGFDRKKLSLLEAQTLGNIKDTQERNQRETAKLIAEMFFNPKKPNHGEQEQDLQEIIKSTEKREQGPYIEKGLESNNEI